MLILSSACTWVEGDLSGDLRTQCSLPPPFHGSNKSLPEADSCGDLGEFGGHRQGGMRAGGHITRRLHLAEHPPS